MTLARSVLITAAVVGLVAVGVSHTHVTQVRLPDGSSETIGYIGEAPPDAALRPLPPLDDPFAADPVFADLARTAAAMDQQALAMTRVARALDAMGPGEPGGLALATALAGPGVCMRSVEYHYDGDGRPPKVVTHSSGNCGAVQSSPPAAAPLIRSAPLPHIETADRPKPRQIVA
jgi:hypothetical protein